MNKSVCIVVNGPPLYLDIFKRAFSNLDVYSETPKEAYENVIVAMEPNAIQENNILTYASKNFSNLFYLGPNPTNYVKLAKYREVMVYDVSYSQLRELQITLGKVHMVANPAIYLDFPPRTKHQVHVYGMLREGDIDYIELFNLSARVTVKLGLLEANAELIAELEEYINHKGIPVTVKIIHTIDEYFKFFNDVDRIIQEPELDALCLASNIPNRELLEFRSYRNTVLASKRLYDLNKILLIVDNSNAIPSNYLKVQTLDHKALQELHSQVTELESQELADDIIQYEKYGTSKVIDMEPLDYHRMHAPTPVIKDIYHLFIEKPKLHLFYGKLPIDYPWIGVLDCNLRQIDELFNSSLFQKSLLTCSKLITYSNLAKEYIADLYNKLGVKSFNPEFAIVALFYPIPMTKHIKIGGNRLVYVFEPDTNPYCIYDIATSVDTSAEVKSFALNAETTNTSAEVKSFALNAETTNTSAEVKSFALNAESNYIFQKYQYNVSTPNIFVLNDTSNPWSNGCSKTLKQRYPILENFSFNMNDPSQSMDSNYAQVKSAYWDLHKAIKSVTPISNPYEADVYITELDPICTASKILAYCIIHSVPIIINKCPLSIEYLGEDYPLYSDGKISSQNIQLATLYLGLLRPKLPLIDINLS
jgi:hypothetical protein